MWLGIASNNGIQCHSHFENMMANMQGLCENKIAGAMRIATCWCIWNQHNDIIFNKGNLDVDDIVHRIKMHIWWWVGIGSKRKVMCNWYEWYREPLANCS